MFASLSNLLCTLIAGHGALAYCACLITTPVVLFIFAFHCSILALSHRMCHLLSCIVGLGSLRNLEQINLQSWAWLTSKSWANQLAEQPYTNHGLHRYLLLGISFKVSRLVSALRRLFLVEDPCNSVHHAVMLPAAATEMRVLSDLAAVYKRLSLMVLSAFIVDKCSMPIPGLPSHSSGVDQVTLEQVEWPFSESHTSIS